MSNSEALRTSHLPRKHVLAAASRIGLSSLVLRVAVDVQRLVEWGKAYPWPRLFFFSKNPQNLVFRVSLTIEALRSDNQE